MQDKGPARRRTLLAVAVVLGAIVASLAAAELALRLFAREFKNLVPQYLIVDTEGRLFRKAADPRLLYEMVPNVSTDALGIVTETNALGFRDRDYVIPKPAGTFRIVGLGDSVAFGLQVPLADSYHERMETLLNARGDSVHYEVVSCAVPGYNMVQCAANYERKASRYEPDLVLVSYFPDDFFQAKIPRRLEYWRQLLEVRLHLIKFVRHRWRARFGDTQGPLGQYFSDPAALAEGKRALRAIYEMTVPRGVRLYVLIHPTLEPEFAGRPHFVQYVKDALDGTDTPILNLFPLYLATGRDIASFRVEPRDFTHPGVEAHHLIARWVVDDLAARGLLPARKDKPEDAARAR